MGYCVCLAEGFHLPPGTQGLVKSLARTRKKALKCSSSKEKGKGGFWAQPGWWHCHGCGCHGCLNWDVGAGTSTRETGCSGFLNTRPNGTEQDKDNASLKEKTDFSCSGYEYMETCYTAGFPLHNSLVKVGLGYSSALTQRQTQLTVWCWHPWRPLCCQY